MRKTINKITFVLMATFIIGALVTSVFAWQAPQLASKCAPDNSNRAFEITLAVEADQIIEFSYDGFTTIVQTTDFVTDGVHAFTLPAGNTVLEARYASDHGAKGSVNVNMNLCATPSTGDGGSSSGGHSSSGSMLYPCHYFPNATPTCQTTPYQWEQWNNPYSKDRIMDEWRCRTFGGDYCPKQMSNPTKPVVQTPAEIYGK